MLTSPAEGEAQVPFGVLAQAGGQIETLSSNADSHGVTPDTDIHSNQSKAPEA